MTPEQERAANDAANKILAEIDAARSADECAVISQKHAAIFARLQKVYPVRAIHIVNLATLRKRDFDRAQKEKDKDQMDLWG